MQLEKWLEEHDIEKMIMDDLNIYMNNYKLEDEEAYIEFFKGKNIEKLKYIFHSVSYVINRWHMDNDYKYISAKLRIEYEGKAFAEYESIYDLNGEDIDDCLRLI